MRVIKKRGDSVDGDGESARREMEGRRSVR